MSDTNNTTQVNPEVNEEDFPELDAVTNSITPVDAVEPPKEEVADSAEESSSYDNEVAKQEVVDNDSPLFNEDVLKKIDLKLDSPSSQTPEEQAVKSPKEKADKDFLIGDLTGDIDLSKIELGKGKLDYELQGKDYYWDKTPLKDRMIKKYGDKAKEKYDELYDKTYDKYYNMEMADYAAQNSLDDVFSTKGTFMSQSEKNSLRPELYYKDLSYNLGQMDTPDGGKSKKLYSRRMYQLGRVKMDGKVVELKEGENPSDYLENPKYTNKDGKEIEAWAYGEDGYSLTPIYEGESSAGKDIVSVWQGLGMDDPKLEGSSWSSVPRSVLGNVTGMLSSILAIPQSVMGLVSGEKAKDKSSMKLLNDWQTALKSFKISSSDNSIENGIGSMEGFMDLAVDSVVQLVTARYGGQAVGALFGTFADAATTAKAAQLGTRVLLTLNGVGDVRETALKNGLSEREAATVFMASFGAMWGVNSVFNHVENMGDAMKTKSQVSKMLNKYVEKIGYTKSTGGLMNEAKLYGKTYNFFKKGLQKYSDKMVQSRLAAASMTIPEAFVQEATEEVAEFTAQEAIQTAFNGIKAMYSDKVLKKGKGRYFDFRDEGYGSYFTSTAAQTALMGGLGGAIATPVMNLKQTIAKLKGKQEPNKYENLLTTIANGDLKLLKDVAKKHHDKGLFGSKKLAAELDPKTKKWRLKKDADIKSLNMNDAGYNTFLADIERIGTVLQKAGAIGTYQQFEKDYPALHGFMASSNLAQDANEAAKAYVTAYANVNEEQEAEVDAAIKQKDLNKRKALVDKFDDNQKALYESKKLFNNVLEGEDTEKYITRALSYTPHKLFENNIKDEIKKANPNMKDEEVDAEFQKQRMMGALALQQNAEVIKSGDKDEIEKFAKSVEGTPTEKAMDMVRKYMALQDVNSNILEYKTKFGDDFYNDLDSNNYNQILKVNDQIDELNKKAKEDVKIFKKDLSNIDEVLDKVNGPGNILLPHDAKVAYVDSLKKAISNTDSVAKFQKEVGKMINDWDFNNLPEAFKFSPENIAEYHKSAVEYGNKYSLYKEFADITLEQMTEAMNTFAVTFYKSFLNDKIVNKKDLTVKDLKGLKIPDLGNDTVLSKLWANISEMIEDEDLYDLESSVGPSLRNNRHANVFASYATDIAYREDFDFAITETSENTPGSYFLKDSASLGYLYETSMKEVNDMATIVKSLDKPSVSIETAVEGYKFKLNDILKVYSLVDGRLTGDMSINDKIEEIGNQLISLDDDPVTYDDLDEVNDVLKSVRMLRSYIESLNSMPNILNKSKSDLEKSRGIELNKEHPVNTMTNKFSEVYYDLDETNRLLKKESVVGRKGLSDEEIKQLDRTKEFNSQIEEAMITLEQQENILLQFESMIKNKKEDISLKNPFQPIFSKRLNQELDFYTTVLEDLTNDLGIDGLSEEESKDILKALDYKVKEISDLNTAFNEEVDEEDIDAFNQSLIRKSVALAKFKIYLNKVGKTTRLKDVMNLIHTESRKGDGILSRKIDKAQLMLPFEQDLTDFYNYYKAIITDPEKNPYDTVPTPDQMSAAMAVAGHMNTNVSAVAAMSSVPKPIARTVSFISGIFGSGKTTMAVAYGVKIGQQLLDDTYYPAGGDPSIRGTKSLFIGSNDIQAENLRRVASKASINFKHDKGNETWRQLANTLLDPAESEKLLEDVSTIVIDEAQLVPLDMQASATDVEQNAFTIICNRIDTMNIARKAANKPEIKIVALGDGAQGGYRDSTGEEKSIAKIKTSTSYTLKTSLRGLQKEITSLAKFFASESAQEYDNIRNKQGRMGNLSPSFVDADGKTEYNVLGGTATFGIEDTDTQIKIVDSLKEYIKYKKSHEAKTGEVAKILFIADKKMGALDPESPLAKYFTELQNTSDSTDFRIYTHDEAKGSEADFIIPVIDNERFGVLKEDLGFEEGQVSVFDKEGPRKDLGVTISRARYGCFMLDDAKLFTKETVTSGDVKHESVNLLEFVKDFKPVINGMLDEITTESKEIESVTVQDLSADEQAIADLLGGNKSNNESGDTSATSEEERKKKEEEEEAEKVRKEAELKNAKDEQEKAEILARQKAEEEAKQALLKEEGLKKAKQEEEDKKARTEAELKKARDRFIASRNSISLPITVDMNDDIRKPIIDSDSESVSDSVNKILLDGITVDVERLAEKVSKTKIESAETTVKDAKDGAKLSKAKLVYDQLKNGDVIKNAEDAEVIANIGVDENIVASKKYMEQLEESGWFAAYTHRDRAVYIPGIPNIESVKNSSFAKDVVMDILNMSAKYGKDKFNTEPYTFHMTYNRHKNMVYPLLVATTVDGRNVAVANPIPFHVNEKGKYKQEYLLGPVKDIAEGQSIVYKLSDDTVKELLLDKTVGGFQTSKDRFANKEFEYTSIEKMQESIRKRHGDKIQLCNTIFTITNPTHEHSGEQFMLYSFNKNINIDGDAGYDYLSNFTKSDVMDVLKDRHKAGTVNVQLGNGVGMIYLNKKPVSSTDLYNTWDQIDPDDSMKLKNFSKLSFNKNDQGYVVDALLKVKDALDNVKNPEGDRLSLDKDKKLTTKAAEEVAKDLMTSPEPEIVMVRSLIRRMTDPVNLGKIARDKDGNPIKVVRAKAASELKDKSKPNVKGRSRERHKVATFKIEPEYNIYHGDKYHKNSIGYAKTGDVDEKGVENTNFYFYIDNMFRQIENMISEHGADSSSIKENTRKVLDLFNELVVKKIPRFSKGFLAAPPVVITGGSNSSKFAAPCIPYINLNEMFETNVENIKTPNFLIDGNKLVSIAQGEGQRLQLKDNKFDLRHEAVIKAEEKANSDKKAKEVLQTAILDTVNKIVDDINTSGVDRSYVNDILEDHLKESLAKVGITNKGIIKSILKSSTQEIVDLVNESLGPIPDAVEYDYTTLPPEIVKEVIKEIPDSESYDKLIIDAVKGLKDVAPATKAAIKGVFKTISTTMSIDEIESLSMSSLINDHVEASGDKSLDAAKAAYKLQYVFDSVVDNAKRELSSDIYVMEYLDGLAQDMNPAVDPEVDLEPQVMAYMNSGEFMNAYAIIKGDNPSSTELKIQVLTQAGVVKSTDASLIKSLGMNSNELSEIKIPAVKSTSELVNMMKDYSAKYPILSKVMFTLNPNKLNDMNVSQELLSHSLQPDADHTEIYKVFKLVDKFKTNIQTIVTVKNAVPKYMLSLIPSMKETLTGYGTALATTMNKSNYKSIVDKILNVPSETDSKLIMTYLAADFVFANDNTTRKAVKSYVLSKMERKEAKIITPKLNMEVIGLFNILGVNDDQVEALDNVKITDKPNPLIEKLLSTFYRAKEFVDLHNSETVEVKDELELEAMSKAIDAQIIALNTSLTSTEALNSNTNIKKVHSEMEEQLNNLKSKLVIKEEIVEDSNVFTKDNLFKVNSLLGNLTATTIQKFTNLANEGAIPGFELSALVSAMNIIKQDASTTMGLLKEKSPLGVALNTITSEYTMEKAGMTEDEAEAISEYFIQIVDMNC